MLDIRPHRICHLIGHKREPYVAGYYTDRRGREREKWYSRCKRCGTSDGGEVYAEGLLERFAWWRIKSGWLRRREAMHAMAGLDVQRLRQAGAAVRAAGGKSMMTAFTFTTPPPRSRRRYGAQNSPHHARVRHRLMARRHTLHRSVGDAAERRLPRPVS